MPASRRAAAAGSRGRRCRPERYGRNHPPPNKNSDNSRRRWPRAHGDYVTRLGHMIVDLAQRRGHCRAVLAASQFCSRLLGQRVAKSFVPLEEAALGPSSPGVVDF
jgi:hypothetical protein